MTKSLWRNCFSSELTENSIIMLIDYLKNAGYLDVYSELTGKKRRIGSDKMSSIRMY